jgi:sugar lactone lactonase YvrE
VRTLSAGTSIAALCFALGLDAQPEAIYSYSINTAVGTYQYGNGGPAAQALLAHPNKIAVDSKGVVYIADTSNNMIRKVVAGQITAIAGTGVPGFAGDGASAVTAQLYSPSGVALDATGNLYIYDTVNEIIRKVDTNGIITTIAGTPGQAGSSGDGGAATGAELNLAVGGDVALDAAGNIYISDSYNSVVRKVTVSTGIISTVAGAIGKPGTEGDGGAATAANLDLPAGLALDSEGNLYIADAGASDIRMVAAQTGIISTFAGGAGHFGSSGDGGPPAAAYLLFPYDVAVDAAGNLYIADSTNGRIRKVTVAPAPIISTLAGGKTGFGGDGGPATAALLSFPSGVAVDSSGTVYIADTNNNRIRTVSNGIISELAGADHAQGDGGKAPAALLFLPQHVAWDTKGNLYIADTGNNEIRKVAPDGTISTAASAYQPQAVAVDSSGNIYIASLEQVLRADTKGNISTIVNTADAGGFGGDGGAATAAMLDTPEGLALDSAGNLYIADTYNHRIRKVSGGTISTVAGSGLPFPKSIGSFGGDGGPATSANLSFPYDVAFDNAGNMLIVDAKNFCVRLVDADGNIHTIAGTGKTHGYAGDLGPATSALLSNPTGVAADNAGNIYIADDGNLVVRMVDIFGVISTIAGNHKIGFSGDGGPAISAELDYPYGLGVDSSGNVWFADTNNHRIRELTPSGPSVPGAQSVVNAASFVSGGVVPGGMATLFGSNLTSATGINLASGLPLGTQFLKVEVRFDNKTSAPIFAVDNVNGQEQINFQVPWELAGQTSALLQVVNNGAASLAVKVPVLAAQPGGDRLQFGRQHIRRCTPLEFPAGG